MSIDNDCVSNLENVEVNPQMEQVKSMILFTNIYQHVHCWYSNDLPNEHQNGAWYLNDPLTEGEIDKKTLLPMIHS